MKKSLNEFRTLMDSYNSSNEKGESIEKISPEEALMVRGGDKEYKPIYDESRDDHKWKRSSMLLELLNFSK